ncbi:MAG: YbgF trimerization domain-containing protein, partial [Arenicellales bacterium]|nr:YbgF trimerization domain-containing protein [Arenicellales bacterium]
MKFYAKTCTASFLLVLVLAGCASNQPASTTKSVEIGSQGNEAVRATVEIQGLRDELARLRNEVELQRNQLDKLTQRQRELYDDLDYRLRQRERALGGDTALMQPPSSGAGFGSSSPGT